MTKPLGTALYTPTQAVRLRVSVLGPSVLGPYGHGTDAWICCAVGDEEQPALCFSCDTEHLSDFTWNVEDNPAMRGLVPDLTPRGPVTAPLCTSTGPVIGACTRLKDHTGRHAAGAGRYIIAVWSD